MELNPCMQTSRSLKQISALQLAAREGAVVAHGYRIAVMAMPSCVGFALADTTYHGGGRYSRAADSGVLL